MANSEQSSAQDIVFNIRVPLHHADFPFVAMWSEKAGCTSLVKWFFWQLDLLDEATKYHPWIHNYENDKFKARRGYERECQAAIAAGKPIVKFVRNPYRRAFSGYLELCNPKIARNEPHWTKSWRRMIVNSLVGYQHELEYGFSFRQYVDWLTAQPRASLDLHLRQQYLPIEDNLPVRICKIDEEPDYLRALEEEFGLKSSTSDRALFKSEHHHNKISIAPRPAISIFDVAIPVRRSRHFHIVEPTLDEIRRDPVGMKLARYFADDFINYGYEI